MIGIRFWLHRLFDGRGPSLGYTVSLTVVVGLWVTGSIGYTASLTVVYVWL